MAGKITTFTDAVNNLIEIMETCSGYQSTRLSKHRFNSGRGLQDSTTASCADLRVGEFISGTETIIMLRKTYSACGATSAQAGGAG